MQYVNCARVLGLTLLLITQGSCQSSKSREILVHIVEDNRQKPDASMLTKRQPELVFTAEDFQEVKVFQYGDDHFSIQIQVSDRFNDNLTRMTSANVGKRLVFISDGQILFASFISGPVHRGKIVVEMAPATKAEAENIARALSKSFEFYGAQVSNNQVDFHFKKAQQLRENGRYDEAIQLFQKLLRESKDPKTKLAFYNEIALGYRLREEQDAAAETYKKLLSDPISIDLNNYMIITQAYFYLSSFGKKRGNVEVSESYFAKLIQSLEYVIQEFPLTNAAQWANLGIATFKLFRGDVKEARNRSMLAKKGDFRGEAYLLLGLTYEYEKKFSEAKEEYKLLIKEHPDLRESKMAGDFIKNLDTNKTNIKDVFKALSLE